ncbi:MAG: amidohydrolase [Desulfobulbaceae bacterium]|nr:amidohydrolase [Desulfobulbaceae bacterium]
MGKTRYIVAGGLIDGLTAEVRRNVFLAVREGIITAIGPVADLSRSDGETLVDYSHGTIIPALVDCSVSLTRSPSVSGAGNPSTDAVNQTQAADLRERHLCFCHAHGVLGVADANDLAAPAPSRQLAAMPECGIVVRSAGADFIKVYYSNNIEVEGGSPALPNHADLCRILAQKEDRKAVVVANGPRQVAEALAAGCDAIEQGYGMGEENLREMAARKVLWIPSVLRAKNGLDGASTGGAVCCRFSQRYLAPGKPLPGAEAFWKETLAEQLAQLRLARTLGVTTATGTGAGSTGILHGEGMVEEMKLFIKAGYSLTETIRCASTIGAGFFGMLELGPLTVGRRATFLIAKGTAQQLPRKLSYLEGIHIDGAPSRAYRKNPVKSA